MAKLKYGPQYSACSYSIASSVLCQCSPIRGNCAAEVVLIFQQLTATSDASYIGKRDLIVPTDLPGTWVSEGCYVYVLIPALHTPDNSAYLPRDVGRTLTQGGYYDTVAMTDESCISYCSSLGYIYAGTEYSTECCEFTIVRELIRIS